MSTVPLCVILQKRSLLNTLGPLLRFAAGPFALLTKVELKHDETTDIESSQVPPDIQNKPCYLIMK